MHDKSTKHSEKRVLAKNVKLILKLQSYKIINYSIKSNKLKSKFVTFAKITRSV